MMNLVSKNPDIAAEWHERNPQRAEEVSPRSTEPALWRCSECGAEWEQAPRPRFYTANPTTGCRSCKLSRKRVSRVAPEDSLAGKYPELVAAIWHPDNKIDPASIPPRSGKEVRWRCSCGKTWTAAPHTQTRKRDPMVGPGCLHGETSRTFASEHPDLVQFWHPDNPVGPTEVPPTSTRVVLWALPDGDTLERSVHAVSVSGHVVPDLPKHPVSQEPYGSQYMDDNPVAAWRLGRSSKEPVRWRCPEGHIYSTAPFNRFNGVGRCPVCRDAEKAEARADREAEQREKARLRAERKAAAAEDARQRREDKRAAAAEDARARAVARLEASGRLLSQVAPDIAAQLVGADPAQIAAGSGVPQTWECSEGHCWEATPHDRVGKGAGCPMCSGRVVSPGVNDLRSRFPDIAGELSGDVDPSTVSFGSNRPYRWCCRECGNEWTTTPNDRTYGGRGCPRCSHTGPSAAENEVAEFVAGLSGVGEVRRSVRGLLGETNLELDIYLPDRAVAIEYNGLIWHSTATGTAPDYHQRKFLLARDAGIRLIQVWEDDWARRRPVVEATLRAAIAPGSRATVAASDCTLDLNVPAGEASELLEHHDLRGPVTGEHDLFGLRAPGGGLVALAVGHRNRGDWHLDRYAEVCAVSGGLHRLLLAVEPAVGASTIVAMIPNDNPTARLADEGFRRDGDRSPAEMLLVAGERVPLTADSPFPTSELPRIFDSGATRWVRD